MFFNFQLGLERIDTHKKTDLSVSFIGWIMDLSLIFLNNRCSF